MRVDPARKEDPKRHADISGKDCSIGVLELFLLGFSLTDTYCTDGKTPRFVPKEVAGIIAEG